MGTFKDGCALCSASALYALRQSHLPHACVWIHKCGENILWVTAPPRWHLGRHVRQTRSNLPPAGRERQREQLAASNCHLINCDSSLQQRPPTAESAHHQLCISSRRGWSEAATWGVTPAVNAQLTFPPVSTVGWAFASSITHLV